MSPKANGDTESPAAALGRGIVAGTAGTIVMTAFQKFVEMPITGRGESEAPADFFEKVLPLRRRRGRSRRALNYAGHFAIGGMWGGAHGLAEHRGLRGQRAVAATFGVVYVGDAVVNTALGLYKPWRWSSQDWAIDVGAKLLLAQATGFAYERLTGPRPG